jgi:ubiquinone biosynthesis protein COQ9
MFSYLLLIVHFRGKIQAMLKWALDKMLLLDHYCKIKIYSGLYISDP